jgi:ParB family chromosome partitioning protein
MTEAIVMDGGKRGQVVKVCADPACRIHHPHTPSPQQVERERAEERKRIEKEKLAITIRSSLHIRNVATDPSRPPLFCAL